MATRSCFDDARAVVADSGSGARDPVDRSRSGLRVAVLSRDGRVPGWVDHALRRARSAGHVSELVVASVTAASLERRDASVGASGSRLFDAWVRWDRQHFMPAISPWARCKPADPSPVIGLPAVGDVDIVLDPDGSGPPASEFEMRAAACWRVCVGDARSQIGVSPDPFLPGRAGLAELSDERALTDVRLLVREGGSEADSAGWRELDRASTETSRVSPTVTLVRLAWLSTHMLERALGRASEEGAVAPDDGHPVHRPIPSGSDVTADLVARIGRNHVGGHAGFVAARVLAWCRRAVRERVFEEHWHIRYVLDRAPVVDVQRFDPIEAPEGRYWADPHVIERDGRFQVFAEEYVHAMGRGRIVTFTIEADGRIGPARVALEASHHLSYPFVFEHAGRTWMVPESGAANTVELFECVEFPHRWRRYRTMMSDTYAVDATLHRVADRWWMFASRACDPARHPHDQVSLFSTDDPVDGEWQAHRNEVVVSDPHRARPAGGLFRLGGKLHRPAQDGVGEYGYAVRLMRIDTLTQDRYAESEAHVLLPVGTPHWRGVHTFTHAPGITLIDVKTRTRRVSLDRLLSWLRRRCSPRRR